MSDRDTIEHLIGERTSTIVDRAGTTTQADGLVARLAGALRARGARPGAPVSFQLPNVLAAYLVYRACWRVGATAVALHHRAGSSEVRRLVELVSPLLHIASPADVDELLRDAEPYGGIDADPDADAVVLFTAGSTGEPKGVRHTHRSLAYKARLMTRVHEMTADDVVLMPAPLAHVSGLLNGVLLPSTAGMGIVLMDRWVPDAAIELIEEHGVSYMVGPPTFFVDLMDAPSFRRERVRSMRLISSGGAGVATTFVDRASEAFGALVKRSYGSTEAPTVATSTAADDPDVARNFDGHAIGDAELRVVDGELQVRGPELFAGYLHAEQTKAVMTDDGWYRTGDTATIDEDGWLTITGRLSDTVIRAGENVSTNEVRQHLEAHPAITEAAVVGVPDDRLGEQVAAMVVTDGTPLTLDEVRSWFSARGVAPFKTPERLVVVDQVPRLPSGKADLAAVREAVRDA